MSEAASKNWRSTSVIAWLAVALFLHALLLLIPLSTARIQMDPASFLEVQLTRAVERVPEEVTEPLSQPPEDSEPEPPLLPADAPIPVEPIPLDPLPARPVVATDEEEKPPLTTARLFQSVRNLELDRPDTPTTRKLGIHSDQALPANWKAGAGAEAFAPEVNRFSELFAPAEIEIVDRWLAADGSHNVVVNLPNGDTVCGRAKAWDPMQPLVEHLMMFRMCSGGGKRTFDMNIPETPRKDFMK